MTSQKSLWNDDSGIAFGLVTFALFLIFFYSLYIIFSTMLNPIITSMNGFVGRGMVSQQGIDSFNFTITVRNALPLFALFGSGAWLIVRALEKKNQEGAGGFQ